MSELDKAYREHLLDRAREALRFSNGSCEYWARLASVRTPGNQRYIYYQALTAAALLTAALDIPDSERSDD